MSIFPKKTSPQPLPTAVALGVRPRALQSSLLLGLAAALTAALVGGCAGSRSDAEAPGIRQADTDDSPTPVFWAVDVPRAADPASAPATTTPPPAPSGSAQQTTAHGHESDEQVPAPTGHLQARPGPRVKLQYQSPSKHYVRTAGGGVAVFPGRRSKP